MARWQNGSQRRSNRSPWAGLDQAGWHDVGEAAARRLRAKGQTLPLTDLAIAVAAARRAADILWSFDSDFERIHPIVDDLVLYDK